MNQIATAKLVLAVAGIVVFMVGIRTGVNLVRFTGIALVASAWLLRFTARSKSERSRARRGAAGADVESGTTPAPTTDDS